MGNLCRKKSKFIVRVNQLFTIIALISTLGEINIWLSMNMDYLSVPENNIIIYSGTK